MGAWAVQNWRCMVAIADGNRVSANMAPASKTVSVMHVSTVAFAMNVRTPSTPSSRMPSPQVS